MVFANVLHCSIDQFWIYIRWIENGQGLFWLQCTVKKGNRNDGKDQQNTKKHMIFIKKGLHRNNLGKNTEKGVCFLRKFDI